MILSIVRSFIEFFLFARDYLLELVAFVTTTMDFETKELLLYRLDFALIFFNNSINIYYVRLKYAYG